jgi:hypothetical protein
MNVSAGPPVEPLHDQQEKGSLASGAVAHRSTPDTIARVGRTHLRTHRASANLLRADRPKVCAATSGTAKRGHRFDVSLLLSPSARDRLPTGERQGTLTSITLGLPFGLEGEQRQRSRLNRSCHRRGIIGDRERPLARWADHRTAGLIDSDNTKVAAWSVSKGKWARACLGQPSRSSRNHLGVSRETGLVTFWGLSTRERESFGAHSWGSRGTFMVLLGPPMDLSQTRESGGTPALDVNPANQGGKRETPGGKPVGVRR